MLYRTILGKLHHIRTTPIYLVARTNLIPASHSASTCVGRNDGIRDLIVKRNTTTSRSYEARPDVVTEQETPISITTTRASDDSDRIQQNSEIKAACGDKENEIDDEMEQEDMFVDAHESFDHTKKEWGGPRRGGRLPEPTRFGDWERKGRCSDF